MNAHIIDAAIRMILQHGIGNTTMSVFAKEAGVSRQTLYVRFPNKEALLRGCIRQIWVAAEADIAARFEQSEALADRLAIIFDNVVVKPRALADQAADSAELFEGTHRYAAAELDLVYAEIAALIARTLAPYRARVEENGVSVDAYARLIQISAVGIKRMAADEAEMQMLLDELVASVLVTAGQT